MLTNSHINQIVKLRKAIVVIKIAFLTLKSYNKLKMCKVREETGLDRSNLPSDDAALLELMRNSRIASMLHWFLMSETRVAMPNNAAGTTTTTLRHRQNNDDDATTVQGARRHDDNNN